MTGSTESVLTADAVDVPHRARGQVRPPAAPAARRAARAGAAPARRRAARLPPRDEGHPRGRLARRAGPGRAAGPPRRDHRPGRPEDGDQRAQLGREDVHGRLRGLELADLAELHRGPGQPDGRARPHDRARYRREAVPPERGDGDAARPPARLAPGGAALRGRRRADVGEPVRLRPLLLPQPRPGRHVVLPAEARVAPRGPALERRLRLVAGAARRAAGDDQGDRPDRDDPRRVRDGRDPLRAARALGRPERGPLGLHLQRDQEARAPAGVRAPRPRGRDDGASRSCAPTRSCSSRPATRAARTRWAAWPPSSPPAAIPR